MLCCMSFGKVDEIEIESDDEFVDIQRIFII